MNEMLTITQKQRLIELNAAENELNLEFPTTEERDGFFRETEAGLIKQNRENLKKLTQEDHRPCAL